MTEPDRLVPAHCRADLQRLKRALASHTDRAYFVGGRVRDFYLDRPSTDVDIEVYDLAPEPFDALMRRLGAKGVGKSFFVYKLGGLDVALPRLERQTGPRHQDFAISWCNDPQIASRRRDFTINALMVNIFSGQELDFHGGLEDLQAGRIVHIDKEAFVEDALRLLRAARFSAQLGFKIAPESVRLCRGMSLAQLPADRIRGELERLFAAPFLDRGLFALMQLGIDRQLLGEPIDCTTLKAALRSLRVVEPDRLADGIRPLLLPWLLYQHGRYTPDRLCRSLRLTRRFCRALKGQPRLPRRANRRFLFARALNRPLSDWLGAHRAGWQQEAQALELWEKPFHHGVASQAVLQAGYQGAAIAQEIRRRILSQIRKQDGKPLPTFN